MFGSCLTETSRLLQGWVWRDFDHISASCSFSNSLLQTQYDQPTSCSPWPYLSNHDTVLWFTVSLQTASQVNPFSLKLQLVWYFVTAIRQVTNISPLLDFLLSGCSQMTREQINDRTVGEILPIVFRGLKPRLWVLAQSCTCIIWITKCDIENLLAVVICKPPAYSVSESQRDLFRLAASAGPWLYCSTALPTYVWGREKWYCWIRQCAMQNLRLCIWLSHTVSSPSSDPPVSTCQDRHRNKDRKET